MTVRPLSKPPLFVPDQPEDKVAWWCSDCAERVPGPWHECKEPKS